MRVLLLFLPLANLFYSADDSENHIFFDTMLDLPLIIEKKTIWHSDDLMLLLSFS
jgi:hypothetical protein